MAKLLYSATMSLDGFIAGPGGDMSWLTPLLGRNDQVSELIPKVGSIVVGRRSYVGDDPQTGEARGEPFGGGFEGTQFVLTHRPPAEPVAGIEFVTDLADCIARAREAAGEREYVNIIGADVARQCLEAGELDEVLAIVAPLLLGDGTRLFEQPGGAEFRLDPIEVVAEPSGTNLWFRPVY